MKSIKTLSIKCDCDKTIDFHELKSFQGGLKERSESDYEKAKTSILKYGWSFVLYYWNDGKTKWIIDGHNRVEVLNRLEAEGYLIPPIPAIEVFCKDKKEAKQKLLRLNSQYGKLTKESVLEFAEDIDLNFDEIALPDTVIDFTDQSGEIAETEGDDEAPEVDEKSEPVSKRGEMYELGNSILMCGDSTSEEDVARLMGGEKADITFTSPPYNMQASGISKAFESDTVKDSYGIGNGTYDKFSDNLSDDDYKNLLCKTLEKGLKYSDEALFNIGILAGSKNGIVDMLSMFKDNFSDILIWNKSSCMPLCLPTQKHLVNHVCELIFCFNRKGDRSFSHSQWELGTMTNRIDTNNQNANEFSKIHHATFPEALPEYVIKNFSERSVLDLFGGTGTTLIASEKLERKCYMMELSERYCDVIRRRYTKWCLANNRPLTSGCLE